MAAATDKQIDGILRRANELEGTAFRYLSQVRDVIGLSSFQIQRGLTSPQASAIISDLDRRLAEKAEAEARAAAGPAPLPVTNWELLQLLDGNELVLTAPGGEVLLRLFATPAELRAAAARGRAFGSPGGPLPAMPTRSQAAALCARLGDDLRAAGLTPGDGRTAAEREQDHAEEDVAGEVFRQ